MTFNLKKRAGAVSINDQIPFDSYLQTVIDSLNASQALPTEDALARISDLDNLSQYGINSFTELKNIVEQQIEMTEQKQNMENNMVAPTQEPGTPVVITPAAKGKNKMTKPYNHKKADSMQTPFDPMGLNDSPEMMGDQFEEQQQTMETPQPPFSKIEDFRKWADNTDMEIVLQEVGGVSGDHLKQLMEQYYDADDEGLKGTLAARIFSDDLFPLQVEQGIMGTQRVVGEVEDIIKKIAQKTVSQNNKKAYNLTKTAQHKSLDNAILWGPGQSRIDPFLHQPVSDWHIVERNKGFGLVVDDIWNIDYETIWRENIMDKYSRPYRDKEGNWVGGYIQKRFEVDKNIPEASNMQLKPGQLRKPVLPEYGNTESRLQNARYKGSIAGAIDTSKPFNWKEASKKKKIAQLKPLEELKELKPLKLPGEKDPTQAISTCPYCNSSVSQNAQQCPNCKQIITPKQGSPHPRKVPQKGERYKDYGPKLDYISSVAPIAASKIARKSKKDKDNAKHDKDTVRDEYESEEFSMCADTKRRITRNDDVRKEDIMRSCIDLAIDG